MNSGFERIIGHSPQKAQLVKLIDSSAMPHAFIFSGPSGIGKRSFAIACASRLLAKGSDKPEQSIALVNAGTHPDFHSAQREEGKKDVSVEAIRQLRDKLHLKSYLGGAIVALVDEAERMNPSAFNALLKTLEEPNPGTYLFLTTNALHALPETIRSRCQTMHFSSLTDAEIRELISRLCPQLAQDPKKLASVSQLSSGSLELFGLSSFFDARTIGGQISKSQEKQFVEQVALYVDISNQVQSVVGSRDTARALSVASNLSAAKGSEHLVWNALRVSLRKRLQQTADEFTAQVLTEVIEAERLAVTRNVAQNILSSELLCKAALLG